jgi:hypothetical protein
MGVYSGLGAAVDIPAIAASMRPAVEAWFSGIVRIIDPNTGAGAFDPVANATTGSGPSLIWEGSARIQPVRSTTNAVVGYAQTKIRGIRFQVPLDILHQGVIRAGLQVFVIDGGEDSTLETYQYTINSGINSSGAWTRTIEADVDLTAVGVVAPETTGYGDSPYG